MTLIFRSAAYHSRLTQTIIRQDYCAGVISLHPQISSMLLALNYLCKHPTVPYRLMPNTHLLHRPCETPAMALF